MGKAEEEEDSSDLSEAAAVAPFEMSALKSKAFKQVKLSFNSKFHQKLAELVFHFIFSPICTLYKGFYPANLSNQSVTEVQKMIAVPAIFY